MKKLIILSLLIIGVAMGVTKLLASSSNSPTPSCTCFYEQWVPNKTAIPTGYNCYVAAPGEPRICLGATTLCVSGQTPPCHYQWCDVSCYPCEEGNPDPDPGR